MRQPLNFDWKYVGDYKDSYLKSLPKDASIINIPHTVKDVPYNYFSEEIYQKISTYEKCFDVDEDIKNKAIVIKFDGFMVKAKIYLNDKYLGEFASLYIPVEIDVSDVIKQKDNRLLVVLDSHEDNNYPPFGFVVDYLTFGGIYREVNLFVHPKTYLNNIYVRGDMNGKVNIEYDVIGDKDIKVKHEIYKDNQLVCSSDENEFVVPDISLWDINNPTLYTCKTIIDGETYENKFGFRNAEFRNDGFYLNNNKLKLVGLNRHQSYPIKGYAMPKAMQVNDADTLKYDICVNVVRTSHYPQSEHFLSRCDEIGLLVINEIPGWQHLSKDNVWREHFYNNVRAMVKKERGHTALIAHGVRVDESVDDHELYTNANKIAHELDKYRQTIGVRNFKGSELLEDIYGYNDFSCGDLKHGLDKPKTYKQNKPGLVTEYLGHMDPVKPTSDNKTKIEVALRHARVLNDNYMHKDLCGAIGWCMADYHTHTDFGSGDHICPHGVLDIYRNKKHSAYIYKADQDKVPFINVISNMKPGDVPAGVFEDIYIITNCDYVKLYKEGKYVASFYPNKKQFPNLKHPPILVDDLIGESFDDPRIPKKYHKKITKALTYAGTYGLGAIKLHHKLLLAFIMGVYKLKYEDVVNIWNEHVGSWGGKAKTYHFEGIIGDKVVATCDVGPSTKFFLKGDISKDVLVNEDTYDAARISLRYEDEHGKIAQYAPKIVHIETKGPIELVGDANQVLVNGQLSVYIFSKNEKGKASVKLTLEDQELTYNLEVK